MIEHSLSTIPAESPKSVALSAYLRSLLPFGLRKYTPNLNKLWLSELLSNLDEDDIVRRYNEVDQTSPVAKRYSLTPSGQYKTESWYSGLSRDKIMGDTQGIALGMALLQLIPRATLYTVKQSTKLWYQQVMPLLEQDIDYTGKERTIILTDSGMLKTRLWVLKRYGSIKSYTRYRQE
jgi:DNA-binding PadR family transcriptional regulator